MKWKFLLGPIISSMPGIFMPRFSLYIIVCLIFWMFEVWPERSATIRAIACFFVASGWYATSWKGPPSSRTMVHTCQGTSNHHTFHKEKTCHPVMDDLHCIKITSDTGNPLSATVVWYRLYETGLPVSRVPCQRAFQCCRGFSLAHGPFC